MEIKRINLDKDICILNPKQAAFYWGEKGIEPIHIYPSVDNKTKQPIIVFVFNRLETHDAYREWVERK
jgi:hypothetical protein